MLFLFGRCISSPRRILFVRPAHPIIVPQSLRLPVHLPVHLPPIHRFGVVPFIRRIPRRAATDLVLFCLAGACPADRLFGVIPFGRCIPRRAATDLVLLHLAGAFSADLVSLFAGAFAAGKQSVASFGWRIPSLRHHCLSRLAHPITHFFACASPCRTTIAHFGHRIPSPRHHCLHRLAHPLAVPPSLFLAGASPRRVTIAYLGWRIPSPCLHRLSRSAHPIAAPPYRISAGASHRRTSIAYLSVCALTRCRTARRHIKVVTFFTPAPPPHQY
jgi:hypothetical protein